LTVIKVGESAPTRLIAGLAEPLLLKVTLEPLV
jgi:hypothetical protein